MAVEYQSLNQVARQANWLEINGNIPGSDRLRMLLESHNCCVICGTKHIRKQADDGLLERWTCPACDIS